jgi:hypothetical protein
LPSFDNPYAWNPLVPTSPTAPIGPYVAGAVSRSFAAARAAAYQSDWAAAEAHLHTCLANSSSRSADCHRLLGFVFSRRGRPDRALEHYRHFVRLMPDHAATPELQGIIRGAEKKPGKR